MNTIRFGPFAALFAVVALIGCRDMSTGPDLASAAHSAPTISGGQVGMQMIGSAFSTSKNGFVVVFYDGGGNCRAFAGSHGSWTGVPIQHNCSNVDPSISGFALGAGYNGVAFGVLNGQLRSHPIVESGGLPTFPPGNGRPVGTLTTFIAADYVPGSATFVVAGHEPDGRCAMYVGVHDAWQAVPTDRNCSNYAAPTADFAVSTGGYNGLAVGVVNGRVRSEPFAEVAGAPHFAQGAVGLPVGDLETVIGIRYVPSRSAYIVAGHDAAGMCTLFIGNHGSWEAVPTDRDCRNYPTSVVGLAVGSGGYFGLGFGILNNQLRSQRFDEVAAKPRFHNGIGLRVQ